MNVLIGSQGAAEVLLHDEAMLKNPPVGADSVGSDPHVAVLGYVAPAQCSSTTRLAARATSGARERVSMSPVAVVVPAAVAGPVRRRFSAAVDAALWSAPDPVVSVAAVALTCPFVLRHLPFAAISLASS